MIEAKEKCNTAIEKLLGAEKAVPEMQDEIVDLQPKLRQSAELVEKGSQAVENESRIMSEVKNVLKNRIFLK